MGQFIRNEAYKGNIQAVVLDWAGTAVDFGCMGPAAVFEAVFAEQGIHVTGQEARQFMGVEKKDHIRKMCALESVSTAWNEKFGRLPTDEDVDMLYGRTASLMVGAISKHADVIPGVIETMDIIRDMGIKIGSSTGYVQEMMDVLVPLARENGYAPDAVFCSSDVPAGRPYPWMCYLNAIELGVYPMEAMVKIGDTIADIEEGLNAGMWTVGIVKTGNEMGLSREELEALDPAEVERRTRAIRFRFEQAGAHYILDRTADVVPVIEEINSRLAAGEQPLSGA
ncbi:MAG: phosphonoacetaldehyde hydrolase [Desulfobacterales bacterium]|nr:phosphonoacetaldehyde hydrolase [Desulfobacterales bacterium]